jgi:hypothetical protein
MLLLTTLARHTRQSEPRQCGCRARCAACVSAPGRGQATPGWSLAVRRRDRAGACHGVHAFGIARSVRARRRGLARCRDPVAWLRCGSACVGTGGGRARTDRGARGRFGPARVGALEDRPGRAGGLGVAFARYDAALGIVAGECLDPLRRPVSQGRGDPDQGNRGAPRARDGPQPQPHCAMAASWPHPRTRPHACSKASGSVTAAGNSVGTTSNLLELQCSLLCPFTP